MQYEQLLFERTAVYGETHEQVTEKRMTVT